MSKIGKKPIELPLNVFFKIEKNFNFLEEELITIEGCYGILKEIILIKHISILQKNNFLFLTPKTKNSKAYCGLKRALIQNIVIGVSKKFTKIIVAKGVGYKFKLENNLLIINVGFTHLIEILIPNTITLVLESITKLSISGIDKQEVGLFAAKIRFVKPPEPYKGKGLLYLEEKIKIKIGKKSK